MDTDLTLLEISSKELATALEKLANISPTAHDREIDRAKGYVLSSIAKIKFSISGPTDFLNHLASQSKILTCLRWLGEFQILACIPQEGSVPIKDIAELSRVSDMYLARIIRLTATAGFLHEPEPGHVAHTSLSAPFVANPSFLDAAMFLTESVAPIELQMAPTIQMSATSYLRPNESAYNLAINTIKPFHTAREERPKLSRQWFAYLQYAAGLHNEDNVIDILAQLNWSNISNTCACIVEVGAQSTSIAQSLADLYPALHFIVQLSDPASTNQNRLNSSPPKRRATPDQEAEFNPRITVTTRAFGARQTIIEAAIYILHLPSLSPSVIPIELQVYLGVLNASNGVMLILTARLLPEPGNVSNLEIEAIARSRDLTLLQLTNEGEIEMVELLEMIDAVGDNVGKLVVINRLYSRNNLVAALVVKYQACV